MSGGLSAFPYVGGKSELAAWIMRTLPEHSCYAEPFAGSASVLLNKPRSQVEVINDLDGDIIQFFRVCRERPEELAEWVESVPYSRQQYEEWSEAFYNGDRPDDPVERAGRFVFLRYAAWGGKYGSDPGFRRASHLNESPPSRIWTKVPDRVAAIHDRLRGVEIENLPALELVDRYDSEDTAFYLDPPYLECETDYYRVSEFDHEAMHDQLAGIEGDAVISYRQVPECYESGAWTILRRPYQQRARRNKTGEAGDGEQESLICNFDPAERASFRPHDQERLPLEYEDS